MKAITFLGAAPAHTTHYRMPDGRCIEADYFGATLPRLIPNLAVRVFVTKKARAMHWERFKEATEDLTPALEAIDIPDGSTSGELWNIFQAVVDAVVEDEEIVFDITHGFRSLPFLSFLAAAYLQRVKQIKLKAVYYGNLEARDQSVQPNIAPVIDLTEFVGLLDWMIAADRFTRFGDSTDLARRLEHAKPDVRTASEEARTRWSHSEMGETIGALTNLSRALRLLRPFEAMEASASLRTLLPKATEDLEVYARPFLPLTQRVLDSYAPIALDKAARLAAPATALERERRLVDWYLERNQGMQAVGLAREWIVSWAMVHLGMGAQVVERESRAPVERALTAAQAHRGGPPEPGLPDLSSLPQHADAVKLFQQLGQLRNDLMHAAKNPNPLTAQQAARQVANFCPAIHTLPLPADPPADESSAP